MSSLPISNTSLQWIPLTISGNNPDMTSVEESSTVSSMRKEINVLKDEVRKMADELRYWRALTGLSEDQIESHGYPYTFQYVFGKRKPFCVKGCRRESGASTMVINTKVFQCVECGSERSVHLYSPVAHLHHRNRNNGSRLKQTPSTTTI